MARKFSLKQQEKADRARVEVAYNATCQGICIDVFDMSKVYAEGLKAVAEGVTDEALGQRVRAFVETIRKN